MKEKGGALGLVILAALCLLIAFIPQKAAAVGQTQYYLHPESNVDTIHATTVGALPCIGEARVLVFYTDFLNGAENWTKSKEEVEQMFFSEEGKTDASLAYSEKDSLRSYYYRSSYGKVDITGTVYEYQTKQDVSCYTELSMVLDEIIEHYRDKINWADYDGNHDGYVDGIYLIARSWPALYDTNHVAGYETEVPGKRIAKACYLLHMDASTMFHETCHMFGPADIYAGVNMNPSGVPTACIMDKGYGDIPSPTKYVLGWLDNAVFVDSTNAGDFSLRSYTNHGDVLVIYPNGDPQNRNWFFVEYVTEEGNNHTPQWAVGYTEVPYGIRVWRTQMNLDARCNIQGADTYCQGAPNSPQNYLEVVQPDNSWNYYYQVGQSLTPYTYPSTAYSDTFYDEGGARLMQALCFSGISISCTGMGAGTAQLSIHLDEAPPAPAPVRAELQVLPIKDSCAFLEDAQKLQFAVVQADGELGADARFSLYSENAKLRIPVLHTLSNNKCNVLLSISPEAAAVLKKQTDWVLSVEELTTYYGAKVSLDGDLADLDFSDIPAAYIREGTEIVTDIACQANFTPKCFRLSDGKLLSIAYADITETLWWIEYDLLSNTVTQTELEQPVGFEPTWDTQNQYLSVWEDHGCYFVQLGDYLCGYRDQKLVAQLDVKTAGMNGVRFLGANGHSYLESADRMLYHMAVADGEIELQPLFSTDYYERVYCYEPNRYILLRYNEVTLVDVEKDERKVLSYGKNNVVQPYRNEVCFANGRYYVFSFQKDLTMYVYDRNLELLEQTCLLPGLEDTLRNVGVDKILYTDNQWMVSFSGISKENAFGYPSTYLLSFTLEGQLTGYCVCGGAQASNASYHAVFPLSHHRVILLDAYSCFCVRLEGTHEYGDWVHVTDLACGQDGEDRRYCSGCNNYLSRLTEAQPHSFTQLQFDAAQHWYVCANCHEPGEKSVHSYESGDTCGICGWKRPPEPQPTVPTVPATGPSVPVQPTTRPPETEPSCPQASSQAAAGGFLTALVIAVLLALTGVGAAVLIIRKKKK